MDSRVENILNGILNDNFDFNNDQSRIEYLLIELGNKLKNMETGGISDEELKNAINECLKDILNSYSTTEEMNSAISEATTDMATNTNVDEKISGMDTRFSNIQDNIDTESARAKAAEQNISDKISNINNTSDTDKPVSTSQQTAIDLAYRNSNAYTDQKISELINGAPETMDTLKEIADEIAKNKDVETALNEAIGKKANQTELDTHTENDSIHVTTIEKDKWNDANDKKHSHSNKSVLDGITSALIIAWNNAVEHITDTVKHITSSERTKWNNAVDNVETHTEQLSALRNTGVITDTTDWLSIPSGHYLVQCENPISADYNGPVGAFQWGNAFVIKNTINNHNSGFIIYIENNAVHSKIWYRDYWDSWRGWESATPQSYTDRYAMGSAVDLTPYTSNDNIFTFPSDGYISIAISNAAAQWIHLKIIAGTMEFTTGVCTPANTNNSVTEYKQMYVKKGMKTYITSLAKATDGNISVYFIPFKY